MWNHDAKRAGIKRGCDISKCSYWNDEMNCRTCKKRGGEIQKNTNGNQAPQSQPSGSQQSHAGNGFFIESKANTRGCAGLVPSGFDAVAFGKVNRHHNLFCVERPGTTYFLYLHLDTFLIVKYLLTSAESLPSGTPPR
jgi:hypothetical protein